MSTIFRSPFNVSPDIGETNSHELVTEPGQAFTTREIYERYIVTGRVLGVAREVTFDSDSKEDLTFDDLLPRPQDLTDIDDQIFNLNQMKKEREDAYKRSIEEKRKRDHEAASQGTSVAE